MGTFAGACAGGPAPPPTAPAFTARALGLSFGTGALAADTSTRTGACAGAAAANTSAMVRSPAAADAAADAAGTSSPGGRSNQSGLRVLGGPNRTRFVPEPY